MPRAARHLLIVSVFTVLSFVDTLAQVQPDQIGQGGQWLSWSQEKKITYVTGFLDGYTSGTYHLCESADALFKVKYPKRMIRQAMPGAEASVLCFSSRNDYSKQYSRTGMDFSSYADVITEFYTKHFDYSAVAFSELLIFLGDGKCDTADQLYLKALNGDLHRVRRFVDGTTK
jgi:hypothetical protein